MAGLYEFIVDGRLLGSQIIQRYNWYTTGTTAAVRGSFALASALGAVPDNGQLPAQGFINTFLAGLSNQYTLVQIIAQHVYDMQDFYQIPYPSPIAGGQNAISNPSFVCAKLVASRTTRAIRGGSKSIAGVPDIWVENNNLNVEQAGPSYGGMATILTSGVSYNDEGNVIQFQSATCSLEEYTSDGKKKRRYYLDPAVQLANTSIGSTWSLRPTVSTQNSRKVGKGS